ncbi:hypothetical protein GGI35DRAFT_421210 [Trichoderma velutinum]
MEWMVAGVPGVLVESVFSPPSLSHFDSFISTAPSSFWVIKSKSPYTSWHMSWRGVDSDILLDLSDFFFFFFFFYILLSQQSAYFFLPYTIRRIWFLDTHGMEEGDAGCLEAIIFFSLFFSVLKKLSFLYLFYLSPFLLLCKRERNWERPLPPLADGKSKNKKSNCIDVSKTVTGLHWEGVARSVAYYYST